MIHIEPYQLRHTFTIQMLMISAESTWLAKQLGHADWEMIRKCYGQWMSGERPDDRNELAIKLKQLDPNLTPEDQIKVKQLILNAFQFRKAFSYLEAFSFHQ